MPETKRRVVEALISELSLSRGAATYSSMLDSPSGFSMEECEEAEREVREETAVRWQQRYDEARLDDEDYRAAYDAGYDAGYLIGSFRWGDA